MTDMQPVVLCQTVNPAVSTGAITATLTTTLLHSLILVFVGMSGRTDTGNAPTDNAGNVYLLAYRVNGGSGGCTELWYARNTQPATVVAITFSGATDTKSVFVREFSGMSQQTSILDTTGTATGTASGTNTIAVGWSPNSRAPTINVASATLVVASPSISVGSFWAGFASQAITAGSVHAIEWNASTVPGAGAGLMTAPSGSWDMGIAAFQYRQPGGTPNPSTIRPHSLSPGLAR